MVRTQRSRDFKVTCRTTFVRLAAAAALAMLVALPGWAAPPTGFSEANIGPPAANGSVVVNSDGTWSVTGSGNDFNGATADQLYFLYQSVAGDGSVIVRLIEQAAGSEYIGPMIRATTNPGSVFAGSIMSTSAVNWIHRIKTDDTAARDSGLGGSEFSFPKWMMVQRTGTVVQGFESDNGKIWTAVKPPLDLGTALGASALFGLCVSSRASSTTTAHVDPVQVLPGVTVVPGLESAATTSLALLTWLPVKTAVGYNIYRGPADATPDKLTLIATLYQGPYPFFLDFTPAATSLRDMSYVISALYKSSDGKTIIEGPALRAR